MKFYYKISKAYKFDKEEGANLSLKEPPTSLDK